ncbi:Ca2+ regulator and membrane fusion protein Fig1-domain-containing protein [Pyrenochaeta sp. MPI-SDFR-AT-0127]|nr:Ca2+ regulator and membrane fusion protein Fig1-domain-containing protein [Pyrenochaeta sp. MPI-SDFR-AT-0127]
MANTRFSVSTRRLVPRLAYHHVLMFGHAVAIVLISIVLSGCSSYSSMTNIYILGLSYTNSTPSNLNAITQNLSETLNGFKGSAHLEVRIGYFGMCVRQRGIVWLCSSDTEGLAQQIGSENDPLDLIGTASKFKSDVLFSGLLFMAIVLAFVSMVLMATFPNTRNEREEHSGSDNGVKTYPSRPVTQVVLTQSFVAAVLLLTAGLWQHIGSVGAAAMAETANYGNINTSIGTASIAMAWTGCVIETLVTIFVVILILSFIVSDRLGDD